MPMDFTPIQHLTLPCGPIAYRHSGSGTPLVLIHGWRGSSRYWQETLDSCADIRSIYAMDLPGHGESPPWRDQIDIEGMARLTIEMADHWGLQRFDLSGHSFGGAVAVYIAAHWPERLRRLVVTSLGTVRNEMERLALGQAFLGMSKGLELARPWLDMARPGLGLWQPWIDWMDNQPALYRAIAGAFVGQMPDDDELVRDGVREFMNTDPLSALEVAVASGSPDFFEAIDQVIAPTLLICGDSDRIMPLSAARALAERLAGCRLVELDHCGYLPMIEQPEIYHRLVREFLIDAN